MDDKKASDHDKLHSFDDRIWFLVFLVQRVHHQYLVSPEISHTGVTTCELKINKQTITENQTMLRPNCFPGDRLLLF